MDNMENNQNADMPDSNEGQDTAPVSVDNVNPNRPDHPNARACVYVEGISVFGFNPNTQRAEVGFFKHMHNPIEMKIFNSECKLIWSSKENFPGSTLGTEININPTKPGMGSRYENNPMDDEDFRRLPDLAKWHGVGKLDGIPDRQNVHFSARLNIYNAVFYTHKMSENNATRYERGDSELINPVPLGRIGRIPGGDIFCSPTDNLEIEITPRYVPSPIKIILGKDDSPYKIVVRASASDPDDHTSHLAHLYNVLKRPAGDQRTFALKFDADEPIFSPCNEIVARATQYECQTFGGGCCW